MNPKTRRHLRSAATLAAAAGAVYISIQVRPFGASAGGPSYGTEYQQYLGRPTVPVLVKRYDFDPSHPDFTIEPTDGAGRYMQIAAPQLDANRLPVFQSTGRKVLEDWTDAQGRAVTPPSSYLAPMSGDQSGSLSSQPGGAVTSADTFGQWFNATPGVNQWSTDTTNFQMDANGHYVMDGSLDDLGAGSTYTAELGWGFVYEEGRDAFLTIETDAEAWVYIDGKLVIDGGGLGGTVEFEIVDDVIIPSQPFEAEVTIAGAAFENLPITTKVRIGSDTYEPFGPLNDPSAGNVDDGNNPRQFSPPATYPAGTPVSLVAKSWTGFSSSKLRMTVDSADNSAQVYVLRDGDPLPDIEPYKDQASAAAFLENYIDVDTGLVTLAPNQIIYLYELWTTDFTDSTADFQDLVVIVTLAAEGTSTTTTTTTTGTEYASASRLNQTIDLSRLDWLEDRHPYRIQVFYANRTGGPADLRIETNLRTLNVLNPPRYDGRD